MPHRQIVGQIFHQDIVNPDFPDADFSFARVLQVYVERSTIIF